MRPLPYIHLKTKAEGAAFVNALYAAGFNWAGSHKKEALSYTAAQIESNGSCFYYPVSSRMVYIDSSGHSKTVPRPEVTTTKPLMLVNSPGHLVSFMRETDRLGLSHV